MRSAFGFFSVCLCLLGSAACSSGAPSASPPPSVDPPIDPVVQRALAGDDAPVPPQTSFDEPTFALSAEVPGAATVGQESRIEIQLRSKGGVVHLNQEYPTRVTVAENPTVSVSNRELCGHGALSSAMGGMSPCPSGRSDAIAFDAESARFDISTTPSAPGPQILEATVSFVQCIDTQCGSPRERTLRIAIDVSPAAEANPDLATPTS